MTPPTSLPTLDPPQRLLAGPGPSNVEPRVLAAMQKPMLGHLDPDLHDILTELVGFPHQATGSSGMECGLQNLLEPGDTAIVANTGFFGNRIAKMAQRTGANVIEVKASGVPSSASAPGWTGKMSYCRSFGSSRAMGMWTSR